ncbi:MAG: DEAD/DEAH box helicase family protein [Leptospiraceae bacterium]|nr:DEAD/DEAH box helicase family protein [Leptospiraceae bacterium]MCP5511460.1 DEAD/DEAH box helicase family protein [Leptospiraceae bacterium]
MKFYETHSRDLETLLTKYKERYINNLQPDLFDTINTRSLMDEIEKDSMKHKLRYYQMDALFLLDAINKQNLGPKNFLQETSDTVEIDTDGHSEKTKIPCMGFEMATGSGKTVLMGAMILYYNKSLNVKDFLVITPPGNLEIYNKTIRNFERSGQDSIWARELGLKINVIHSDNFTKTDLFHSNTDINVYVFNTEKFGELAKRTKNPNENARHLIDENGNLIGLQKYLQKKKLVLFTDEAHHTQSKAKDIIRNFHPQMILEFTATADEKKQKVIYKYNIKHLLEDKYCKTVMALGVSIPPTYKKEKGIIANHEKIKLFTILLVHLAKKYCLPFDPATKKIKPIAFIRINGTIEDGNKIHEFLKNNLCKEKDIIRLTLSEIEKEAFEITEAIHKFYEAEYDKNEDRLLKDIQTIIDNSIFHNSTTNKKKEVQEIFGKITNPNNPCELVLFLKTLNEGIDLPNIYTIGVINDNNSNLLTSVKQVIGRGVRLNKPNREFDTLQNSLIVQTEKLHVICDKERNFEKVIGDIQREFGVSDRYLGIENKDNTTENNEIQFPKKLQGKFFPKVKMELKIKPEINDSFEILENTNEIVEEYIKYNCFQVENGNVFLKFSPSSILTEVEVFNNPREIFHQIRNNGGESKQLVISEKIKKNIITRMITNREICLVPDVPRVHEIFDKYFNKFMDLPLYYLSIHEEDAIKALNVFQNTFVFFFRNYLEKRMCDLQMEDMEHSDGVSLNESFKEHSIKVIKDKKIKVYIKENDEENLKKLIKENYYFSHFKHSYFKHTNFDSYPEYQTATILDQVIELDSLKDSFWIRNERQLSMEYGHHRYYPDFLLCTPEKYYVIETKGRVFSSNFKNFLLKSITKVNSDFIPILLFEEDIGNIISNKKLSIESLLKISEENFISVPNSAASLTKKNKILNYIKKITDSLKFKSLLPVYSFQAACGKFGNAEEVEELGWVKVEGNLTKTQFIAEAVGKSMEPLIREGDYLIFDSNVVGTRQDRIVLAKCQNWTDPENNTSFTIKKYYSRKKVSRDTEWEHEGIELHPINPEYQKIVLQENDPEDSILILAFVVGKYDPETGMVVSLKG